MPTATLTSKGQITLPKKVRDQLHLRPGDAVEFLIARDGEIRVKAGQADVRELFGCLRRPGRRPVSLTRMDQAIARGSHRAR